jgi:hypothetical protein
MYEQGTLCYDIVVSSIQRSAPRGSDDPAEPNRFDRGGLVTNARSTPSLQFPS